VTQCMPRREVLIDPGGARGSKQGSLEGAGTATGAVPPRRSQGDSGPDLRRSHYREKVNPSTQMRCIAWTLGVWVLAPAANS
jgi:hypothetical protein